MTRITFGAIPSFSITDQRFDLSGRFANDADGVALGIGEVDVPFSAERDPLGPGQLGQLRWSAVSGVATLPGPGQMLIGQGSHIDSVDSVSFSECQDQRPLLIEVEGPWTVERSPLHR